MEEDVIRRIYLLTNELTSQQHNNQQLANELTTQLLDLKTKATTKQSTDDLVIITPAFIPPEQRDEIIDTLKSRLAKTVKDKKELETTNSKLRQEIDELQTIIKDYEASLEAITDKFRVHRSAIVDGQLQQKREYEALLSAEKNVTAALFSENVTLQNQLCRLGQMLRQIYNEDSVDANEERLAQLVKENEDLRAILGKEELSEQRTNQVLEKTSPVLLATKTGVVEEFFN